jgi:bifunctional DNA-binding transcriptional regulator/antitoxin component of YhaV-PrlF toxin-antitoxin module
MNMISGKIAGNGRVTVPLSMRQALGLEGGGNIVLELADGEIRVRAVESAMADARALTRQLLGKNSKASVDDFLAERQREAAEDL